MKILIAILSCHARPFLRLAQRETWINDVAGADYRFFLGRPAVDPPEDHCVYLACEDTYAKLTSKTHAMVKWALAEGYDFVFKCDDDTYIRPDRLLSSNFAGDDYSGFTGGRWGDVPGPDGRQIVYAYAQGGAGYWLSRRALAIVAEHMLVKEYCEDCAVGKTLALHGIAPILDARYCAKIGPRELSHPDARANYITMHKCDRLKMQRLYAADRQEKERLLCVSA